MRIVHAVALLPALLLGCTPYIPVKDDFGVSALAPASEVPPEFAAFNAYDPSVGGALADQICATGPEKLTERDIGATPGHMVQTTARCRTHVPLLGDAVWPGTAR